MEVGEPQELPLPTMMADKGPVWENIRKKYGLREDVSWDQLGTWTFAVRLTWDCFHTLSKG